MTVPGTVAISQIRATRAAVVVVVAASYIVDGCCWCCCCDGAAFAADVGVEVEVMKTSRRKVGKDYNTFSKVELSI